MRRIAAIAASIAVLVISFLILGNRSAEGPAQGGAATGAAAKNDAPKGPPATPVTAGEVHRDDLRQRLEVTGSLKTDEDVQIGSRIAGKVIRVAVKEGDRVRRGQVLVRLDPRELRTELARAQGTLAAARAKLSMSRNQSNWKDTSARSDYDRAVANLASAKAKQQQAETNAKLVDVETRTKVQQATADLNVANERLTISKESTRKQELRQAQLAVEQAQAQMTQTQVDTDNARDYFERRQKLFKQDAIAKEEVDEAERRYKAAQATQKVAQAAVSVAQQKLELAQEGSRPEEVRVAEEQVRAARQALDQAKSDERRREVAQNDVESARAMVQQADAAVKAASAGLVQTRLSEDDIRSAAATVEQAKADIQYYQTQLADLSIVAPVDGVVSTRQVNEGEMVTTSSQLMSLVATNAVYFEAQVPELEVSQVRPGAPAVVTVDALGGRKLAGAVREVIPVADRSSRMFRVRVAVMGAKGQLPAGGYARATVDVGTKRNVLVVSRNAIRTEAGDSFVWLIQPGDKGLVVKRQDVRTGLVSGSNAEVLGGLKDGQQVVTAGSPSLVDGTPVSLGGTQ